MNQECSISNKTKKKKKWLCTFPRKCYRKKERKDQLQNKHGIEFQRYELIIREKYLPREEKNKKENEGTMYL